VNDNTRHQAIAIAAAIFAARDLATGDIRNPHTARAVEDAIYKAKFIVEIIERKLT
jgi:hypothetical protein